MNSAPLREPKAWWSLGFGLENIGLLVLKFPKLATLFLGMTILFCAFALPKIGFDGNIVSVLDAKSDVYKDFVKQARSFHDYSGDVIVVVKDKNLLTAQALEGLRNLHLDLTLEDGVDSVFSIFSLGDVASDTDQSENLLPTEFENDQQAKDAIAKLLKVEPSTKSMVSPEKGALMLLVRMEPPETDTDAGVQKRLDTLSTAITKLGPKNLEFSFSGMPQIRTAIVAAIIADQTKLTFFGIVLGAFVAWYIFGTVRAAVLCTIPAFFAVAWALSTFAITGIKLNFFTTSLPTLALIITFADTIVLYFKWQALDGESPDTPLDNLKQAIRRVGPASSLTSITTALAFASFSWASTQAMDELAFFGVCAVIFSFLALIITLPLAGYWSIRWFPNQKAKRGPRLTSKGGSIAGVTTGAPYHVVGVSIAALVIFGWVHTQLKPSYSISDYLPYGSEIRKSEKFADKTFGGTSQYYITLPVTEGGSFADQTNRARLIALHDKVGQVLGEDRTQSLAAAWRRLDDAQVAELVENISDAPPAIRGRFLSEDQKHVQVSSAASAGENTTKVQEDVRALKQSIGELPFAEEVKITGLAVLLSRAFPELIEELRTGLLISILFAVIVVGIATRNPALALASLVPNLIPILFTETVMWLIGANLSVTNVIALTIAFGISIDNAVHVINAYSGLQNKSQSISVNVRSAVAEIAPALLASTGIICVAAIITQASSMPSVAELGQLLIATLIVALISNLAILPSAMIVILRLEKKLKHRHVSV